jgi:hypothetical protein
MDIPPVFARAGDVPLIIAFDFADRRSPRANMFC